MNNYIFLLFGVSGDLAKRKLIPALYQLYAEKKLGNVIILGVAHTVEDRMRIVERAQEYIETIDQKLWQEFVQRFFYLQADVTKEDDMTRVAQRIEELEKEYKLTGNRIAYLAVAGHLFAPITQMLAKVGICRKLAADQPMWHRIVYEKPFGYNSDSAHEINQMTANYFYEAQIYRIDHYLTKEIVSNIALLRFTNAVFEPLWNNRFIDQVHIILDETMGIEGRAGYYDNYGAVRDVVQNHMLQLLALVAMEMPHRLTSEYIRDERYKVLQNLVCTDGLLGQYEGYLTEPGVKNNSTTETFALLRMQINNSRWQGVPFFIRTGKKLRKNEVAVHIKFKAVDCLMIKGCSVPANWLTISLSPDALFSLRLNVKKPGYQDELVPIDMSFCHSCVFKTRATQAYEALVQDVVQGEQASAVRADEIEAAWHVVDTLMRMSFPLYSYTAQSDGPHEIERCIQQWNMYKTPSN